MKSIQFIQISPEQLKKEIVEDLKNSLLPELKKELRTKETDTLMTRQEVANKFTVSISTIDLWRKKGLLQDWGIGSRVYMKRSEVEKYLTKLNYKRSGK